ncbi:MAG: 2-oxoisovalerate dehydrogenase, partial [Planctomycetota bacterium]
MSFQVRADGDGGFVATAESVRIVTQGDTLDELKSMVLDAVRGHFD